MTANSKESTRRLVVRVSQIQEGTLFTQESSRQDLLKNQNQPSKPSHQVNRTHGCSLVPIPGGTRIQSLEYRAREEQEHLSIALRRMKGRKMLDWKEDTTPNRVVPALEASTFFLGSACRGSSQNSGFLAQRQISVWGSVSFIFTIIAHLMKDKFWNRKFKISSFQ